MYPGEQSAADREGTFVPRGRERPDAMSGPGKLQSVPWEAGNQQDG